MKKIHIQYLSHDHKTLIHAVRWVPDGKVKGVLQISHGMVEFIERYEEFAKYMTERGFLVTGNDHLGHGESIRSKEKFGFFSEKNGNSVLLLDLYQLQRKTKELYPNVPYFMLGHSMGSFLGRQYLCCYGNELDGAIIMGTGYHTRLEAELGMKLCKVIASVKGWDYRSKLIDAMAFGSYNRKFKPVRTQKDWLTRDQKIVDTYIADERCQFIFTVNGYYHLFLSLAKLGNKDYIQKMPKNLPVLFVSGEDDPVGNFGKGVKKVVESFRELGMKKVSCKLYPDDRHEILNELDRDQVYEDLYEWLKKESRQPSAESKKKATATVSGE